MAEFTRGILINVAGLKEVERLEKRYAISVANYKAALKKLGIKKAGTASGKTTRGSPKNGSRTTPSSVPANLE